MSLEQLKALAEEGETEVKIDDENTEVVLDADLEIKPDIETEEESEFELVLEDEPEPHKQKYTAEETILWKMRTSQKKAKAATTENDALKQQIENLTKTVEGLQSPEAKPQPATTAPAAKFPDLYDVGIDGDQAKLDIAIGGYFTNLNTKQAEAAQVTTNQTQLDDQYREQQGNLAKQVGAYATENKISANKAAEAVTLAVNEIDTAYGAAGALQFLLNKLDQSDVAKVTMLLGTNEGARNRIIKALAEDRGGYKATVIMANFAIRAKSNRKISGAPEPDEGLQGDATASKTDSALQKAYDTETDYMKLRAILNKAKEKGVTLKT